MWIWFKAVIEQILEPLSDFQGISVCLHPEDAKSFRVLQDQALSRPLNQIVIEADSSLSLGDVIVQSRSGYFKRTNYSAFSITIRYAQGTNV